jgi:hypothetical protein
MKTISLIRVAITGLALNLVLVACTTYPTLIQVARTRQNPSANKNDPNIDYKITDRDVLDYTDQVKTLLSSKFSHASLTRYGSSTTQATLGALAAAASTAGWAASTASGFGLGATYIFGLGQTIDAKAHAQAYEQAFTAIQSAESTYYFYQVGMAFKKDANGKVTVDSSGVTKSLDSNNIPSPNKLTPDGETLYYRVSKILKVLDDALANKIPDLQDLKDAKGDSSGSSTPPAKPGQATTTVAPAKPDSSPGSP